MPSPLTCSRSSTIRSSLPSPPILSHLFSSHYEKQEAGANIPPAGGTEEVGNGAAAAAAALALSSDPFLFVSGERIASSHSSLLSSGVTHVLNLASARCKNCESSWEMRRITTPRRPCNVHGKSSCSIFLGHIKLLAFPSHPLFQRSHLTPTVSFRSRHQKRSPTTVSSTSVLISVTTTWNAYRTRSCSRLSPLSRMQG